MSFLQRLARVRFPERAILITYLLFAGLVWGFIALADEVLEGDSQRFDEWAVRSLRRADDPGSPIGSVWMHDVARDVTALGGPTVIALVTASALGFLLLQRKRHAMWLVAASVFGGGLLTTVLKETFGRERPDLVPHLARVTSLSFPSGHAMLAAVTYLTLAALLARTTADRGTRIYLLVIGALLVIFIGLSRIYLGVHYPTDVLAGWTAGIAWALLCAVMARWLQRRGKVEPA